MEPRARVSVWPGRRRVPGIVAPDSWGARGAECLPRDVLRRSSPATSPCDGTTGADVCAMERVRHHGSTPPRKQCTPGASWGLGVIAPPGQFRAGFSEQQQERMGSNAPGRPGPKPMVSPEPRIYNNAIRDRTIEAAQAQVSFIREISRGRTHWQSGHCRRAGPGRSSRVREHPTVFEGSVASPPGPSRVGHPAPFA